MTQIYLKQHLCKFIKMINEHLKYIINSAKVEFIRAVLLQTPYKNLF